MSVAFQCRLQHRLLCIQNVSTAILVLCRYSNDSCSIGYAALNIYTGQESVGSGLGVHNKFPVLFNSACIRSKKLQYWHSTTVEGSPIKSSVLVGCTQKNYAALLLCGY